MVTKEEWNSIYFSAMAMASVAVGTLGVAIGLLALKRSQAEAVGVGSLETNGYAPLGVNIPKVHYNDGQVLVQVRNPGEWHELREFINPLDPRVQQVYHQVGPDAWLLFDWVCHNVSYRSDDGEWWEFPGETIKRGSSDCDGSSILLTSLLRNFTNAYVAVGEYRGLGHAWVLTDGEILETTYTYAHAVPDPQNYHAYAKFNDQEVLEMWPGAMSGLFQLARNECQKLTLMAEVQRG